VDGAVIDADVGVAEYPLTDFGCRRRHVGPTEVADIAGFAQHDGFHERPPPVLSTVIAGRAPAGVHDQLHIVWEYLGIGNWLIEVSIPYAAPFNPARPSWPSLIRHSKVRGFDPTEGEDARRKLGVT
jgi:hypothetical protein